MTQKYTLTCCSAALLSWTTLAAPLANAAPEPLTQASALAQQSQVWELASELRASRPSWAAQVDAAEPSRSRTGSLVFLPSQVKDPAAATLLVARSGRNANPAFRRAVAEALPETHHPALGALIASELTLESSALVRVSLAHALRYAEDAPAEPALLTALKDQNAQVRETALASIRAHQNAAHFGQAIIAATQDPEPRVQAAALRAWGSLRNPALAVDIQSALRSESGIVRLAALRGQWRVDRETARNLAEDLELQEDPDPKVARLAARILGQ